MTAPPTPGALFLAFTRLALQGFGGVLPVAQRDLVEHRQWLSRDRFVELLSVAQVLPGPNVVNLALMVGDDFRGTRGALAALGGLLLVPLVLVLALAAAVQQLQDWPAITGALRGMGVVAAGLIGSTAFKLAKALQHNALGRLPCALLVVTTIGLVTLLGWPLAAVVLGLGGLSCVAAWYRVGPT